jgi:hypothetical protein
MAIRLTKRDLKRLIRLGILPPDTEYPARKAPARVRPAEGADPWADPKRVGMNRTENRYADLLEVRKIFGEIRDWHYERTRFILADKTTLLVDFDVVLTDGEVEYHEVKGGFIREDAWVKLKVAADKNRSCRFYLCQSRSARSGFVVRPVGRHVEGPGRTRADDLV